MRQAEEFKRQAEKMDITFWESHKCSICNIPVGTEIYNGEASYRSSCGCASSQNHSHGWQYVADRYNLQDHPDVIKKMDIFWGF